MALADGKPGYTPPARIQQMRRELWWLPQWWAGDDDIVWNGEDRLSLSDDAKILPWGWSPAIRHQLRQAGVRESLLPSAVPFATDPKMMIIFKCSGESALLSPLRAL